LDFPDPFGPTMTDTPGANSRTVLSAKDLNPRIESERRNIGGDANSVRACTWEEDARITDRLNAWLPTTTRGR
jgi:hypothetical protein